MFKGGGVKDEGTIGRAVGDGREGECGCEWLSEERKVEDTGAEGKDAEGGQEDKDGEDKEVKGEEEDRETDEWCKGLLGS